MKMKTRCLLLGTVAAVCGFTGASYAADISGTVTYSGTRTGPVQVSAVETLPGDYVLELGGAGYVETTLTNLPSSAISIQYWFRGSSLQSAVRQQASGYIVAGWQNTVDILSNDGGTSGISVGNGVLDGNWHELTMTWQEDTPNGFASYLDGELITSRDSLYQRPPG